MSVVQVEYVGGPAEGMWQTLTPPELMPRREVAVPRLRIEPIWEAVQPHDHRSPFRRAVYVLHRYGERYEYVHAGTYDD